MVGRRLRRRATINPALDQGLLLAVPAVTQCYGGEWHHTDHARETSDGGGTPRGGYSLIGGSHWPRPHRLIHSHEGDIKPRGNMLHLKPPEYGRE